MVRKIGTNKTQVLHRIRMCQFTSRQAQAEIRIKPQEWRPDQLVSLKNDDLYARAWESEDERPIFDAEINNATSLTSPKTPVQSDLSIEETRNTPGTAQ